MNAIDTKQLEEILLTVSKPGRYLGNEWNVTKKDLSRVNVKFALAFPDIYDVGMSYLGFRIIYGVLNNREDIACERVFAPWVDFEEKLRTNNIPLFSLESKIPIKDFDIIGFSLNYELNYTNVLNMLDLAGIPLRSKERDADYPLVIAGGPCAFNPEPMAEFIDAFIIGDGEEVALEVVDVYKETSPPRQERLQAGRGNQPAPACVTKGGPGSTARPGIGTAERAGETRKEKLLKELANIEGVYVPSYPKEIKKRIVKNLDGAFYPTKEIVPYVQVIHDRITLEIMRGCPFNCKFCQASAFYKPVRLRSKEKILELAKETYRNTGYEEISLLSLSSGNYPGIISLLSDLTDEFKDLGIGISLPSLRSEDILKSLPSLIVKTRKTGLTFAPEAGSERLRKYINKDIDIEEIVLACDEAFRLGWRLVKFYFMIGLPTETYEDLEGISNFIHTILNLKKDAEISVSINSFVPKTHTPFENEKMDDPDMLIDKQKFLRERLRNRRIKLKFHDIRLSFLEGKFSHPDKAMSEVIYVAWRKGARFDSWREFFNFEIWREALKEVGLDRSDSICYTLKNAECSDSEK